MKTAAVLVMAIMAISMLAVQTTHAQDVLEADNITEGNLFEGVTISWTTNQMTTGWISYGFDSVANATAVRVNDTRGPETTGFTHICRVDLGPGGRNRTLYYQVFAGDGIILSPVRSIHIPDIKDDLNPPSPMTLYGHVENEIAPVAGALIHITITQGNRTSLPLIILSHTEGQIHGNTGNGIFFENGDMYDVAVADVVRVEIESGPMGSTARNAVVESSNVETRMMDLGTFVLPLPFSISAMTASPMIGTTETNFTFSITYSSGNPSSPSIYLLIGGQEHLMTLQSGNISTGAAYTYTTTLPTGNHTYSYRIVLGDVDITTGASATTITVTQAETPETPPEGMGLLLIGIIVIIAVAVAIAVVMKKRTTQDSK